MCTVFRLRSPALNQRSGVTLPVYCLGALVWLTSRWAREKPCLVSPPPPLRFPTVAPVGLLWTLTPQEVGKWGLQKTNGSLEEGWETYITMKIYHRL